VSKSQPPSERTRNAKTFSVLFLILFSSQASVAAMLYSETDASVEALLVLMDKDQLKQVRYISEYPVLTALARHRNPSKDLVDKFNAYLAAKDASFPYLKKLYLVYSALVNRYCDVNSCDASDLVSCTRIHAGYL
jgi:hypothetical protein